MSEKEDITVKESGLKVGDILVGQTHMYRTITYWYEIIKVTEKRVELRELPVAYRTAYMSNTPGDSCMPVLNVKGNWFIPEGFPYTGQIREYEPVKGKVVRYTRDTKEGKKSSVYVSLFGNYTPLLSLWDGAPGWVNCD